MLCGLCADFDCDPNPCQNGGTCFSEGGCSCPPGFNGVNCEMGTSNARTTSVFPHDVRLIRICSLITVVYATCLFKCHVIKTRPCELSADELFLTDGSFGHLYVTHNGVNGTVCDDYFEDVGCMVVCGQLGFKYVIFFYFS